MVAQSFAYNSLNMSIPASISPPTPQTTLSPDSPSHILNLPPEIMAMIGQAILDTASEISALDDEVAFIRSRRRPSGYGPPARFGTTCRYIKDCTAHVLWTNPAVKDENSLPTRYRSHVQSVLTIFPLLMPELIDFRLAV